MRSRDDLSGYAQTGINKRLMRGPAAASVADDETGKDAAVPLKLG